MNIALKGYLVQMNVRALSFYFSGISMSLDFSASSWVISKSPYSRDHWNPGEIYEFLWLEIKSKLLTCFTLRFKGLGGGLVLLGEIAGSTTWFSTSDWKSEVIRCFLGPLLDPLDESFRSQSPPTAPGGGVWLILDDIVFGTEDVESFVSWQFKKKNHVSSVLCGGVVKAHLIRKVGSAQSI